MLAILKGESHTSMLSWRCWCVAWCMPFFICVAMLMLEGVQTWIAPVQQQKGLSAQGRPLCKHWEKKRWNKLTVNLFIVLCFSVDDSEWNVNGMNDPMRGSRSGWVGEKRWIFQNECPPTHPKEINLGESHTSMLSWRCWCVAWCMPFFICVAMLMLEGVQTWIAPVQQQKGLSAQGRPLCKHWEKKRWNNSYYSLYRCLLHGCFTWYILAQDVKRRMTVVWSLSLAGGCLSLVNWVIGISSIKFFSIYNRLTYYIYNKHNHIYIQIKIRHTYILNYAIKSVTTNCKKSGWNLDRRLCRTILS